MVSIIIVNYFHKNQLVKCLESINKNKIVDFEIVIVNNSPKESLQRIIDDYPKVKIIEANNIGFGRGCNFGAKISRGKYLAFLNPDSVVSNNWLKEALKSFKKKRAGIVMSKILSLDGKIVNSWGGEVNYTGFSWAGGSGKRNEPIQEPYEVSAASGASFFIGRKLFKKLGGFDPKFFMYVEDLDLSFRARLLGYKVLCAPRSLVFHDYEFNKGDYKLYYLERNRLFFIFKNYSLKMILLFLPAIIFLELGLWTYFLFQGKIKLKFKAVGEFFKNYKYLARLRKLIRDERKITDKEMIKIFSSKIESNEVNRGLIKYFVNPVLAFYFKLVKILF